MYKTVFLYIQSSETTALNSQRKKMICKLYKTNNILSQNTMNQTKTKQQDISNCYKRKRPNTKIMLSSNMKKQSLPETWVKTMNT